MVGSERGTLCKLHVPSLRYAWHLFFCHVPPQLCLGVKGPVLCVKWENHIVQCLI